MALNPSNGSNLEPLVLKGLNLTKLSCIYHYITVTYPLLTSSVCLNCA